ncbi:MAG: toll/interleukin-1 receptor domain-containing protein [Streptosporangiaceae bacterium]|jgi:hypothetical protein
MSDEQTPVRVFISYAHDDPAHEERVRDFWLFLRGHGVDARLDLAAAGRRVDWAEWTTREVRDADRVLVIASPEYKRRAEGDAKSDVGQGVQWEARMIREVFYANQRLGLDRVVPVVLPGGTPKDLPLWLAPASTAHYVVREFTVAGAEALLRLLTEQPLEIVPTLGIVPVLPPRDLRHQPEDPPAARPAQGLSRTPRASARPTVVPRLTIIVGAAVIVIGALVATDVLLGGPPFSGQGPVAGPTFFVPDTPTSAGAASSAPASPHPSATVSPGSGGLVREIRLLPLKPAGQVQKISLAFGSAASPGLEDGVYERAQGNGVPELTFNDPFKLDVSAQAAQDKCASELILNSRWVPIVNLRKGLLICVQAAAGTALLEVTQDPGRSGPLELKETYWPNAS